MTTLEYAIEQYDKGNKEFKVEDFVVDTEAKIKMGDCIKDIFGNIYVTVMNYSSEIDGGVSYGYKKLRASSFPEYIYSNIIVAGKVVGYNPSNKQQPLTGQTDDYVTVLMVRHSLGGKLYYFYNPNGKYLSAGSVVLCQTSKGKQVATVELCIKINKRDIDVFNRMHTDGHKLKPIVGVYKLEEQYDN